MGKAVITEQYLHDIADAIIAKGGATASMTPAQMPEAIAAIPSGELPTVWDEDYTQLDIDTSLGDTTKLHLCIHPVVADSVSVDWGDGTPLESVPETKDCTIEHDYVQHGKYSIRVLSSVAGLTWRFGEDGPFAFNGNFNYRPYCNLRSMVTFFAVGTGQDLCGYTNMMTRHMTHLEYLVFNRSNASSGTFNTYSNGQVFGELCKRVGAFPPGVTKVVSSGYFSGLSSIKEINKTLCDLVVPSNATNVSSMFRGCYSLTRVPDVLDLSSATNVTSMFYDCYSLTRAPDVLDLSSATDASNMFRGCYSLTRVPDVLDLSSVTNVGGMFYNCYSLTRAPDVLDLSSVTNVSSMFYNCYSLTRVPDVLDLSSVTNVGGMFYNCYSLTRLPTRVTVNLGLSFASVLYGDFLKKEDFDRNSVAVFDADGNVIDGRDGTSDGGFVGNLNSCANSGQTMTFSAETKKLFSADEWTAIKACLAAKNWGCSPA